MQKMQKGNGKKDTRPLHFINAVSINGYLWTNALEWNGYYKVNGETGKAEFLGLFEHADIFADKLFYQVLAYQKYVFFIPWFSDYLVRLDIENLNTKYWRLPQSIISKVAKFRAAYILNGKIFMFPMYGDVMCFFDIEKEGFSCDTKWTNGEDLKKVNGDFLQGCLIKDKLYLPTCLRNSIFKYEINGEQHENILFPQEEKGVLNIEKYSEKEVLVLTWKGNVWKYNLMDGEREVFYEYKGEVEMPYFKIIKSRDSVYLFPAKEKSITRLKNKKEDVLFYPKGWEVSDSNTSLDILFCEYYKNKNYVYLYPILGNMLLQLDTENNMLKGVEIYDDFITRKKEIKIFIKNGYPFIKVLNEDKIAIDTLVRILEKREKLEKTIHEEIGSRIWKEISRR